MLTERRPFEAKPAHLALLIAVVAVFYGRTIDNYWFKDDLNLHLIVENGEASTAKLRAFLWPSHMQSEQYWRPLPVVLGFADYLLWDTNPAGFHIVNLLLHALNAVLVYAVVNRLARSEDSLAGFAAALIFAVNPIDGEAVVWVLQRMVLMCTTFSLMAILAWLKGAETGSRRARGIGIVLLIMAILCKEIAATLPAVFFFIDLVYGEPTTIRRRLLRAIRRALPGAIVVAAYTALRFAIFGRLTIKYAGLEPQEYAAQNRVFERMGESLRACFLPFNASRIRGPLRDALTAMALFFYLAATLRAVVLAVTSRTFRKLAGVFGVLVLVSFVPTLYIFWVDENLFNARFFYQPGLGVIGIGAAALWMPMRDGTRSGAAARLSACAATAAMAIAFAIGLAIGLGAFEGASRQVDGIRGALSDYAAREAALLGEQPVLAVLNTPSQYQGVPTIEWYVELLLKAPLHAPDVPAIALLDTLEPRWFAILEERRLAGGWPWERLRYVRCEYDPPGIRPVFGAVEPAVGENPPILLDPADGRALANAGPEVEFRFRAAAGATRFRLRLDSEEAPTQRLLLEVGVNATRAPDGTIAYRFSAKDAADASYPDIWLAVVKKKLPRPLAVRWRIEAVDAAGATTAVSADRRLVIFDTLP